MTSDGRVPDYRPYVDGARFIVGDPVRASTWLDHAKLAHWVAGRGAVLVPSHSVGMIIDNTTENLLYYVPASGRAMYRMWVVEIRPTNASAGAVASMTANATTTAIRCYPSDRDRPRVYTVLEEVASISRSEQQIQLSIASDTTSGLGPIRVESVACWELPRATLDRTTDDCGIALDSLYPRRPIYADGLTPQQVGIPATVESIHEMSVTSPVRRIGHIARWGYPLVINSGGAVQTTYDVYRLVPRKDRVGDTTKTVRCRVYGTDSAGVGQVRLVGGTAGAGSWANMAGGTGWSDPAEVDIDCEDQSSSDGLPGGGYDTVAVEIRTDGVNSVDVNGWCVYEYD